MHKCCSPQSTRIPTLIPCVTSPQRETRYPSSDRNRRNPSFDYSDESRDHAQYHRSRRFSRRHSRRPRPRPYSSGSDWAPYQHHPQQQQYPQHQYSVEDTIRLRHDFAQRQHETLKVVGWVCNLLLAPLLVCACVKLLVSACMQLRVFSVCPGSMCVLDVIKHMLYGCAR